MELKGNSLGGNEEEKEAEVEKRVVRVFRERAKWQPATRFLWVHFFPLSFCFCLSSMEN